MLALITHVIVGSYYVVGYERTSRLAAKPVICWSSGARSVSVEYSVLGLCRERSDGVFGGAGTESFVEGHFRSSLGMKTAVLP